MRCFCPLTTYRGNMGTSEHKCNSCFYMQNERDRAPCVNCTGYDKYVTRNVYIKQWDNEDAFDENKEDVVNHPKHYKGHPSGVECIQITEHMGFNLGNAVKYIWRCDLKKDAIEDLKKAIWYLEREVKLRESNL